MVRGPSRGAKFGICAGFPRDGLSPFSASILDLGPSLTLRPAGLVRYRRSLGRARTPIVVFFKGAAAAPPMIPISIRVLLRPRVCRARLLLPRAAA